MASIRYILHFQSIGWEMGWSRNGLAHGFVGVYMRAEAIRIQINDAVEGTQFIYRAHVEGHGWLGWVNQGEICGTVGEARKLQAIEIRWLNNPANYQIFGRLHVETDGWHPIFSDESMFGSVGRHKQIQAVQFWLVEPQIPSLQNFTLGEDRFSFYNGNQEAEILLKLDSIKDLPGSLNSLRMSLGETALVQIGGIVRDYVVGAAVENFVRSVGEYCRPE